METLCTAFEAHVAPTPTSKRAQKLMSCAQFPWHWPITTHQLTRRVARHTTETSCMKECACCAERGLVRAFSAEHVNFDVLSVAV